MHTYLVVFYGAALLALVLTPLVVRLARAVNVLDEPGLRKVHAAAIPRLGGLAIVIPTLALILPVFLLDNEIGKQFRDLQIQLGTLLGAGALVFAVGLVDDILGLAPRYKLTVEVVAAAVVCIGGTTIDGFSLGGGHHVSFGWFAIPLTMLWIVGITNAVNLIDGLDGLAAGISLITCTVICSIAVYVQRPVMAVLMLALIGSLIGFLFYNFNPAKIFLGDCGSLFLGFMLGSASIVTSHKTSTLLALALPVLALGVPIFDTLFSMLRRLAERRSMFAPDRGHIHHRLLSRGLDHRHVVLLLYGVSAAACGLGLLMVFTQDIVQLAMFGLAIAFLVFVFRFSGVISLKIVLRNLNKNQVIAKEIRSELAEFNAVQVALREAHGVNAWWDTLCQGGRALGFAALSLEPVGDARVPALRWLETESAPPRDGRAVGFHYTLHDEGGRPAAKVEGVLSRGSSFESVGRRAALFGRLLDEHGIGHVLAAAEKYAGGVRANAHSLAFPTRTT